jgi:1-acyl-sn-glycerol-3-phosphate acyltransferase
VLNRSRELLRTAFAGVSLVGLTGTASAVVAALSFVDERAPDPLITVWADAVLRTSGVRTRVRGLENLPSGNFVLCANHQSNFDVLVLFRHIERHMRFVAKAQLLKVPVFGYALKRAGNIFVDRQGTDADRSKLNDAVRAVRERVSVVFFAEGTRSDDGVLRPFKKGAAIMAIEAQVPLVPVAVAGTHRILPKGTAAIHPRPAALVIGKPIETAGLSVDARDAVTERAHAEVERLLAEGDAMVAQMELER